MTEYKVICPDGKVRRPAYEDEEDAQEDAGWFSGGDGKCLDPYLGEAVDCPGGKHRVEKA